MKNFILIILICSSSILFAQKKVDGLLSINEYYGKVVSRFNGEHFWVKHNQKYHLYDKNGNSILKDITLKNQIDVKKYETAFSIKGDVFIDYDKTKIKKRFFSISNKKPLSNYVYSTIIPYDNGTYFAIKSIGKEKEYIYLDENLKVIYKVKPQLINEMNKQQRNPFTSKDKNRIVFGSYNDGLVKNYNPTTKKFGFNDTNGKLIIANKYKSVGDFSEGLAFFQNDDKLFGYINTTGKVVIPAKYLILFLTTEQKYYLKMVFGDILTVKTNW